MRTEGPFMLGHSNTALSPRKEREALGGDYYILTLGIPGVLVECGFLSNTAESEILQTPSYQMLLAMTICCAALKR